MKNKMSHMRDHMFAALERLSDEGMTPEQLKQEVSRCKAISDIGKVIVESAKTEILHARINGRRVLDPSGFVDEDVTGAEPKQIERPPAVYNNGGHLQVVSKYAEGKA